MRLYNHKAAVDPAAVRPLPETPSLDASSKPGNGTPSKYYPGDEHLRECLASWLPNVALRDGVMDLTEYLERGVLIDQGAFGEVFRAEWKDLPSSCDDIDMPPVAVKVVRGPRLNDEKQRQKRIKNMRREMRVWQNLVHEHILPFLGTANLNGDDSLLPAIVSPWMYHGTITEYLAKYPDLPKLPFLVNIIDALLYLHCFTPCIVHGDMKAANVLVNLQGQLFVCDFGLSRMTEDATLWVTTATHAGYTTRWAPPEMLNPEDGECQATMASDIYSYAMTCFEILSGQVPFAALRTEGAVVMAVAVKNKRPDRELVSDISDGLWDLMTRCWAKNPEERPSTKEVAEGMNLLSGSQSGAEHSQQARRTDTTPTPPRPPPLPVVQDYTDFDNPYEPSLSPWQRIHRRFLQWALTLPVPDLEKHLKSTLPGQKADGAAVQIWLYQVYKRYVRIRMAERPPQNVDCLFIPSLTADDINTAVLAGRSDNACTLLKDLWDSFGFERPPRLLLTFGRHSEDQDYWVVHSYSLAECNLTTYDSCPERALPDPLGWWHAIRLAWPDATNQSLSLDDLTQKVVRSHRPRQSVVDNSVATAGILENILNGLRPESLVDIERIRGLMSADIESLLQLFYSATPQYESLLPIPK